MQAKVFKSQIFRKESFAEEIKTSPSNINPVIASLCPCNLIIPDSDTKSHKIIFVSFDPDISLELALSKQNLIV